MQTSKNAQIVAFGVILSFFASCGGGGGGGNGSVFNFAGFWLGTNGALERDSCSSVFDGFPTVPLDDFEYEVQQDGDNIIYIEETITLESVAVGDSFTVTVVEERPVQTSGGLNLTCSFHVSQKQTAVTTDTGRLSLSIEIDCIDISTGVSLFQCDQIYSGDAIRQMSL